MFSAGRLSFSHKQGSFASREPLECQLKTVKGETSAPGQIAWTSSHIFPRSCLQKHCFMSGKILIVWCLCMHFVGGLKLAHLCEMGREETSPWGQRGWWAQGECVKLLSVVRKRHIWQDGGISHAIAHFPHTERPINSEGLTLQCSSLDGGYYTNNMIMLTS